MMVIAPTGTMTEDRVAFMKQHREAIIEFLRAEERDRVRCVVMLPEPYPDEPNIDDPAEGRAIIAAVESVGGWLAIERGRIVLQWRGDPAGIHELIARIWANRRGVVTAITG